MQTQSKWIIAVVFVAFATLNVVALADGGLQGLVHLFQSGNLWTYTLIADLFISLGLIASWMIADARAKGRNSVPYVVLTFTLGSIGPLLYLLRSRARPNAAAARHSPVHS